VSHQESSADASCGPDPPDAEGQTEGAPADYMGTLYDQLRAVAGAYFKRQPEGHTLQPTALVHEAFLRLARHDGTKFNDREHFFAVAATAMRQILASHARKRRASKRGGDMAQVTLTNLVVPNEAAEVDLVALDEVLTRLETLNERQAKVVEYRFFGGLTLPEIAKVLDVSLSTVEKEWRRARAWLAVELDR
jgi:RNA polymerase sigma factor (TIGR02999 family)